MASLDSIDYFLQVAMLLESVLDAVATTALKPFPAVHWNPAIMVKAANPPPIDSKPCDTWIAPVARDGVS